MEQICAAQAMEWNVELERGLRSNKPGAHAEAILKMGPRLQRWSEEPVVTASTASLFELDTGQDRAFANSILLRLADAFRTGNNFSRLCVLKVFLLEFRRRHCKKGKEYKGIFAKERVPNHLEMLKRVKAVLHSGDVVARSLALRALGCLADLGKDSADIRRVIVEAIESPYLLEVNAALFATGCLCEYSKDFASVILKKLTTMANAMKTAPEIKLGAVRIFAKMGHSPTIAHEAHEAGKGLMLKLPTDEIVTSMLLSLSRLAAESVVTLSDQVDLLLSYLSSDPRYIVRAMSLKCFSVLSAKAIRHLSFHGKGFTTLLTVLKDISLPPSLHCLVLQVLRKLSCHYATCVDAYQLLELVSIVEIAALHPDWSKKQAAVSLLVDLTCNIEKLRKGLWAEVPVQQSAMDVCSEDPQTNNRNKNEDSELELPIRVTRLVFDHIALVIKNLKDEGLRSEGAKHSCLMLMKKRESQSLFNLILRLVGECPSVRLMVVDCIKGMVESLVNREVLCGVKETERVSEDSRMDVGTDENVSRLVQNRPDGSECDKKHFHASELIVHLCHFLRACLDMLDMEGGLDSRIYNEVKQLTEYVVQLDSSSNVLCTLIPSLLMSCRARHFGRSNELDLTNDRNSLYDRSINMDIDFCLFQDQFWSQHEKLTLDVANNMMKGRNFWGAYRIGIHSACHGAWLAASSTFRHLVNKVQSESCYFWLKSVALLAEAESKLHDVMVSAHGLDVSNECRMMARKGKQKTSNTGNQVLDDFDIWSRYGEIVAEALKLNYAATNSLSAAVHLDRKFEFQRWFLNLRGKLMKNAAELVGLLSKHLRTMDNKIFHGETNSNIEGSLYIGLKRKMQSLQSLKIKLLHISCQFGTLANEFDLLSTSFMDIDSKSFRNISSVAVSCSLLSFCTIFAVHFPKASIDRSKTNTSLNIPEIQSHIAVVQDLAQRLRQMDEKIWEELQLFSKEIEDINNFSTAMTRMSGLDHQERAILRLCRVAISEVLSLQDQAKMVMHEVELYGIWKNGLHLLGNVTLNWFHLPKQIPIYFFQTRAHIGVELFARSMDKRNPDGISVCQGFQLPLSLCIQVKNIIPGSSLKVRKICCIIDFQPSGGSPQASVTSLHDDKMQEILDFREELFMYMGLKSSTSNRISEVKTVPMKIYLDKGNSADATYEKTNQTEKAFVTFQVDERGQGFATCSLDVSAMPCGLYQTTWHCACLDNRGHYWSLHPLNAGPLFNIKP